MTDFAAHARAAMREQGLSMRAAARALNYDHAFLSRVLNGKQRPSTQLAHGLDELIGADGALIALVTTLTDDDRARIAHSVAAPSRIDSGTVQALADVLSAQRRLDDSVGSAVMLPGTVTQLDTVTRLARDARGRHRPRMVAVVAEWTQFAGWLHASVRCDQQAVDLFSRAEDLADEAEDATMAATAVSFRGYVAWRRGRYGGMLRAARAALATPGAHVAQRTYDTLQSAQAYAALGHRDDAARYLDKASALLSGLESEQETARPWHYYYSEPFFRLQIGLAYLKLGDYRDAADHLGAGLDGLPEDQRAAEWADDYRGALAEAQAAA